MTTDCAGQGTLERSSGRYLRSILFLLLLIGIGIVGCVLGRWYQRSAHRDVTTAVLSPNEAFRAKLMEWPRGLLFGRIDRNFEIYLRETGGKGRKSHTKVIFRSPDEGKPIGSERFIWSRDSRYLLLVGRKFYVEPDVRLSTGEQLYFLFEVSTARSWCNASQVKNERFDMSDLVDLGFDEIDYHQVLDGFDSDHDLPVDMGSASGL